MLQSLFIAALNILIALFALSLLWRAWELIDTAINKIRKIVRK